MPARIASPDAPASPKSVIRTLPSAVEHHVGRLEIAVDDVALVRGREPGADLPGDLEAALFGEPADALEQRPQVLAVDILHRQKRRPIDFVDVVDAADVRMRHLTRHPHFGVELRQARGILVDVGRQELQRDWLAELQIVSSKDFAHPAASESLDDPVAPAEEGAGLEAAVVDRARG